MSAAVILLHALTHHKGLKGGAAAAGFLISSNQEVNTAQLVSVAVLTLSGSSTQDGEL